MVLTSLSFSFSSASVSFTLLTNICLICSSLSCSSPMNSLLLATYVSCRLRVRTDASVHLMPWLWRLCNGNWIYSLFCYMLSLRRRCSTWRVRCQGWCLWSPSPPVCSGGTAHSVWRGSVPSGPSCWHELASLSALQSHSDSRSPLRTIITSLIIWCSSDDVYSNQDTVSCLFCINVDKLLQDALRCLNRHTVYL